MKKPCVLAFLGLLTAFTALGVSAQGDIDIYESDRRYCASGRSGVDFRTCMWRIQNDRERYDRQQYDQSQQWGQPPPPPYDRRRQPPPVEKPRLSDMQQRALDNCIMLPPRDQPRCRATVMSTVR